MIDAQLPIEPGLAQVAAWRRLARNFLRNRIAPDAITWQAESSGTLDFAETSAECRDHRDDDLGVRSEVIRIDRMTMSLLERVGCHRAGDRFAMMYQAIWRIQHGEHHLFDLRHDPLVHALLTRDAAVRREMHKTKAFVRFEPHTDADGRTRYAAWFEPEHYALEFVLPFFQKRFANMEWSILTPMICVHWDGTTLRNYPGVTRQQQVSDDVLRDAWPTYYANIFNPARLKVNAMVKEMPKRYWSNLPEARLIPALIGSARSRTNAMIVDTDRVATSQGDRDIAPASDDLNHCTRCSLGTRATQAVKGEGPVPARIMLIGEQPGDLEDLSGVPFTGPAGAILDAAFADAGIARDEVYLTNAVKHFAWVLRGKRRIHKTPAQAEILACRGHLLEELERVNPVVIVALGQSAARALLHGTSVDLERGEPFRVPSGRWLIQTYHPAFILRTTPMSEARSQLVAHLRIALRLAV